MNQAALIAAVAERAGLTKADAGKTVEALVGTITEALTRGDEIRISGFGSFGISERSERQGRNPQTGEAITIARCVRTRRAHQSSAGPSDLPPNAPDGESQAVQARVRMADDFTTTLTV
jgi:DNA-binding protein HU-beta